MKLNVTKIETRQPRAKKLLIQDLKTGTRFRTANDDDWKMKTDGRTHVRLSSGVLMDGEQTPATEVLLPHEILQLGPEVE